MGQPTAPLAASGLSWLPIGGPNALERRRHDATTPCLTAVATTVVRSPARPARQMGDPCRQVSWLAARSLLPGLPDERRRAPSVASLGEARRLQLRGQPRLRAGRDRSPTALHRVPFSPAIRSDGWNRHDGVHGIATTDGSQPAFDRPIRAADRLWRDRHDRDLQPDAPARRVRGRSPRSRSRYLRRRCPRAALAPRRGVAAASRS